MNKLYFIISMIFMSLSFKTFCSEAFFQTEFDKLPDITSSLSVDLEQTEIHKLEEKGFDKLFPKMLADDKINHSSFVGRIFDNQGRNASGLLYAVEIKEEKLIGTGISALHNFCLLNFDNGHSLQINNGYRFAVGGKIFEEPSSTIIYAAMRISEVIFDISTQFKKDVCLFRGEIILAPGLFQSNNDFISFFYQNTANKKRLPKLISSTNVDAAIHKKKAFLYHFPMGKKEMRRNKGSFESEELHSVRTLPGSSGAPLFNAQRELIGIHIGDSLPLKDKFVYYFSSVSSEASNDVVNEAYKLKVSSNNRNRYDTFFIEDYESLLREGVDLYRLDNLQKLELHFKLISTVIETIKSKNTGDEE